MLYHGTRKSGFLYNALDYANKKKRKASKPLDELMMNEEAEFTDEEKDGILKFFKRCVLPKDRKEVEKKLMDTKVFRREVILNNPEKYQDCWQFYFVQPDLVCYFKFSFG